MYRNKLSNVDRLVFMYVGEETSINERTGKCNMEEKKDIPIISLF